MYVEVVVKGSMGDLAASAFPGLVVERRQVFVASEALAFAALDHLVGHNVSVVMFRLRPNPAVLAVGDPGTDLAEPLGND